MKKSYIVQNKPDDYGSSNREIVITTLKNAKEYYYHELVPEEHMDVLKHYFDVVEYEDETERTNEERFYGN